LQTAFEWEGELDPNDFSKWPVIEMSAPDKGIVWVRISNPDTDSDIETVSLAVSEQTEILLAYKYFKLGEPYFYRYDRKLDKFVRYKFTHKERSQCMECHELNQSI